MIDKYERRRRYKKRKHILDINGQLSYFCHSHFNRIDMKGKRLNSKEKELDCTIPYKHCLNCGTELNGKYCHICGQEATSPVPSVKSVIFEYFNHAFIWDSKIFKTLWSLISKPGHLTNEFLSGKFVSYVHPLKLNMFFMFVFLTMLFLFSSIEKMDSSMQDFTKDEVVLSYYQFNTLMNDSKYAERIKKSPRDTVLFHAPLLLAENFPGIITNIKTIEDNNSKALDKWTAVIPRVLIEDNIIKSEGNGYYRFATETGTVKQDLEMVQLVGSEMLRITNQYFPILVLLTVPFLSLSLRLIQHKAKTNRINRFIFSLHYTAFLELVVIFIYLIYLTITPPTFFLESFLTLSSCTYLTLAFRKVYKNNSWFKAVTKALLFSLLYLMICLFAFICVLFVACFIIVI